MWRAMKSALAVAAALLATAAQAAWPERPVTLVVPFAAGGISDTLARITAERLQSAFKQAFIVANEGGAAGIIGATRVARAKPDGYTLMFTPIFLITFAPLSQKIEFDPIKDFAPIAIVAKSAFAITVGGAFPANTLAEFIAYVKAKPGQLTFGSAGAGSLTHFSSVAFLKNAGLDMIHVPYRGLGPAFTDLLAGHIHMLSATPVELKPYVESNKVKPLAISSRERSKYLPNVPTIMETLPTPEIATYNGLLAPAGTPDGIVKAISREIMAAEKSAEFQDRLTHVGVDPIVNAPGEFANILAAETARWRDIVRDLGLQVQ